MEVVHPLGDEASVSVLLGHGPVIAAWIGHLTSLGVLEYQDRGLVSELHWTVRLLSITTSYV
jgi:hypothetical protein